VALRGDAPAQGRGVNGTYAKLAITFSVLSVLGFGGGKGIIPQMHVDAVDHNHWITSAQFAQFYTIGKLVPGPTTIFAGLIGYAAAGFAGALIATACMFVPSTALMIFADNLWSRYRDAPWKDVIARGLAPVIVGLVWSSVLTVGRGAIHGPAAAVIAVVVTALTLRTQLSAPVLILLSGAAGAFVLR
jgi:chromate transporter